MERHDGGTSNRAQGERCKPEIGLWTGALQPRSSTLPMCFYRDAVTVTDRWNKTLDPRVFSGEARAGEQSFNIPKFNLELSLFRVVWEIISLSQNDKNPERLIKSLDGEA